MRENVVVITGASAGIGAALAELLAKQGMSLVLVARRKDALESIAARCAGRAHAIVADVAQRAEVRRVVDGAIARFGRIDVLVNNVGQGISRLPSQLTDEDVDEVMRLNVKSALYGMQAVVPHFQQRGSGHLINVSSFLGRVPLVPIRSAYNAAKAALNALTANLRVDLKAEHPGIHVSLVMPGVVTTDFARNALGSSSGSSYRPPASAAQPQTPEEAAAVIARLIEHPQAEIFTNPAQIPIARRYYEDVAAFEEQA